MHMQKYNKIYAICTYIHIYMYNLRSLKIDLFDNPLKIFTFMTRIRVKKEYLFVFDVQIIIITIQGVIYEMTYCITRLETENVR